MSTIIKAGKSGEIFHHLSTVDLADHLREADAVIERAKQHAESLVEHAKSEVGDIRQQAHEAGYKEGYELGRKEGLESGFEEAFSKAKRKFDQDHSSLVSAFRKTISDVERMKQDLELQANHDILTLAVSCAKALTFKVGSLYRESAQENLQRAIRSVGMKTDLTIRVSQKDYERMKTFAPNLIQAMGDEVHIQVVTDESMKPGGCVVETPECQVDATLETQIDQVVSLLLGSESTMEPTGD